MSLIAALEALVESGATPEMMLAVVRVYVSERDAADEARRAKDAARQTKRRSLMPEDWFEVRARVFVRDGYICTYCGTTTDDPHCDHITPLSRGGSSDESNLTTSCRSCNTSKGARTPEEWRAAQ